MPDYRVVWEIDLTAESPREAAREALAIQRNPGSWATVFTVNGERIDLSDTEDDAEDEPGVWREHSNQLGDWCPWSGKPVIVGDDVCPAMCPSSADDYDPDEDDEEEESEDE